MINAIDARNLQKSGVPQSEYYANALNRCEGAIVDQARKGKSNVTVALAGLTKESFDGIVEDLTKRGFTCSKENWNANTSSVDIAWNGNQ